MRKWLSLILSVSLVISSFFTLASVVSAESKFKITEDAAIAARIKAFTDIKALFTANTVLTDVKAFYVDKFQTEVKRIDATIKPEDPKIDDNIVLVLDNAIAGKLNVNQAKQAIDKGLQWYFYLSVRDLINNQVRPALKAGDTATAQTAFYKVVQTYEGVLESTVVKRDTSFNLHMADILKGTIEQLLNDLASGNADDFNVHRQVLDKTLIKTYALGAYTYAKNIPTKPAADQPAAMTEGYFFFMTVYSYLKGGSAVDADYIRNAFASGDASQINTDKIQDAMQRTMIGKVSEYVNQALVKLEAGDLQGARGYAMEGNMFLSAQEVFFGAEKYAAAAAHAQQFSDAVDKSDLASAKMHAFQVLKFLVVKDGVQLKVGDKKYQINGTDSAADVAPYINPQTSRTLVPVRVIAEALQAEVKYDAALKKVIIVKDGKTTELMIGSVQIVQNGEINADVKLDQPVVVKNARSFIPLRAVAELFGKRVFYEKGEIIILR
ncbi:stalk domain-containing protein [Paenibacillus prosopidis]|uniref:Copper amine oxidase-like protein n=1 Tax=Paenibacillus prosopidis TaxID=630520 RepID=A0A368W1Y9_9BACL|nr:copper amine oxidase N-terminal domain-containing protein [Paenibacillus prosopidis]RCW49045.1 copper amine oxidase-like protein [Paenibacillus prosopidis]